MAYTIYFDGPDTAIEQADDEQIDNIETFATFTEAKQKAISSLVQTIEEYQNQTRYLRQLLKKNI